MTFFFQHPHLLWLIPVCLASLLILRPRSGRQRPHFGAWPPTTLAALALVAIILAAAGISFRHSPRKNQLVIAVDVSDSVVESQSARVEEMLGALDPDSTDVALAVFGRTQGLERPMTPLARFAKNKNAFLPDAPQLTAVADRNGTDVAAALQFARTAFASNDGARAVLVLSDFRDTANAPLELSAAASAFNVSGIDLLATPAILGASSDVRLSDFRAPETAASTRAIPLDITVAAQRETVVKVRVSRASPGRPPVFVDAKIVKLDAPANASQHDIRRTIRILDTPQPPGVAVYTATLSGPEGPLPGDVLINNSLSAAVRVSGPSTWAVLTRADSTLSKLAGDLTKPLGVSTQIFVAGNFPADTARYDAFAGILLDGLSAAELPDGAPALRAIESAVLGGKALVTLGGSTAYGAGGHPRGGTFEKILPAELTPQDDRARTVLFLLDVSRSMDERFTPRGASRIRKLDHAAGQLLAVQNLRPQDRLGLIEFSGSARVASALSSEPTRTDFLDAARALKIQNNTDLVVALELARKTLDADNAEEQMVVLISDGIQTISRAPDEIQRAATALCPTTEGSARRRTTLWTFGIGVEKQDSNSIGKTRLKELAATGGGKYSPDFENLREGLSRAFDENQKDYFTRLEAFVPRLAAGAGSLVDPQAAWPQLKFLNRIKSKNGTDVLLWSRAESVSESKRPDPLLIFSGPADDNLARRASLAFTLDGPEGTALLGPSSAGRGLLANVLAWAESRNDDTANGFSLLAEPIGGDKLEIELRAFNPQNSEPLSTLKIHALLTVLQPSTSGDIPAAPMQLKLEAPGVYRAQISAPPASVCRLSVRDNARTLAERFVSTPCAAEARAFGVDRAAMTELISKAGTAARVIESPRDLAAWAASQNNSSGSSDLRGWMLGAALIFLLASWSFRARSGV